MRQRDGIYREAVVRLAPLLLLLVMVTLQVGRSVHIYSHNHHLECAEEHGEESRGDDSHDCSLCHFTLSPFISSAIPTTESAFVELASIETQYIFVESQSSTLLRQSRAPPAAMS